MSVFNGASFIRTPPIRPFPGEARLKAAELTGSGGSFSSFWNHFGWNLAQDGEITPHYGVLRMLPSIYDSCRRNFCVRAVRATMAVQGAAWFSCDKEGRRRGRRKITLKFKPTNRMLTFITFNKQISAEASVLWMKRGLMFRGLRLALTPGCNAEKSQRLTDRTVIPGDENAQQYTANS